MAKEAVFTLKLEAELRVAFISEAQAAHRPASQIVRDLMREFVRDQRATREHDAWFRRAVEQALAEADDPQQGRISHDEITRRWHERRAELLERANGDEE